MRDLIFLFLLVINNPAFHLLFHRAEVGLFTEQRARDNYFLLSQITISYVTAIGVAHRDARCWENDIKTFATFVMSFLCAKGQRDTIVEPILSVNFYQSYLAV